MTAQRFLLTGMIGSVLVPFMCIFLPTSEVIIWIGLLIVCGWANLAARF